MFLNSVTVVLCGDRFALEGATIAWATKIEKDHVLVSLPAGAALSTNILSNRTFSVSVLGERQSGIARQYGGREQSRPLRRELSDLDFSKWAVPVVKSCRANLLCTVEREFTVREQHVFVARIDKSDVREDIPPLVYEHAEFFG